LAFGLAFGREPVSFDLLIRQAVGFRPVAQSSFGKMNLIAGRRRDFASDKGFQKRGQ
jgi:hypothetical protein